METWSSAFDKLCRQVESVKRADLAKNGQAPSAVVVTCSDSRVIPEKIFSANPGDIFVIRTAGNVVSEFERGTVEYGVLHLGAKLVLVLGHTQCGAVAAALGGGHDEGHHEPLSLSKLVEEVKLGVGDASDPRTAEIQNARHSRVRLLESDALREQAEAGVIKIVCGIYNIASGEVTFLEE